MRVTGKRLALQWHAAQWFGTLIGFTQLASPALSCSRLVLGHGCQLPTGSHDGANIAAAGAQLSNMLAQCLALGSQHIGHIAKLGLQYLGTHPISLDDRLLGFRREQLLLHLRNLPKLLRIGGLCPGRAQLLVSQP